MSLNKIMDEYTNPALVNSKIMGDIIYFLGDGNRYAFGPRTIHSHPLKDKCIITEGLPVLSSTHGDFRMITDGTNALFREGHWGYNTYYFANETNDMFIYFSIIVGNWLCSDRLYEAIFGTDLDYWTSPSITLGGTFSYVGSGTGSDFTIDLASDYWLGNTILGNYTQIGENDIYIGNPVLFTKLVKNSIIYYSYYYNTWQEYNSESIYKCTPRTFDYRGRAIAHYPYFNYLWYDGSKWIYSNTVGVKEDNYWESSTLVGSYSIIGYSEFSTLNTYNSSTKFPETKEQRLTIDVALSLGNQVSG